VPLEAFHCVFVFQQQYRVSRCSQVAGIHILLSAVFRAVSDVVCRWQPKFCTLVAFVTRKDVSKWLCSDSPAPVARPRPRRNIYSVRRHLKQTAEFTFPPSLLRRFESNNQRPDLLLAAGCVLCARLRLPRFFFLRSPPFQLASSFFFFDVVGYYIRGRQHLDCRSQSLRHPTVTCFPDAGPISAPNGASAFNSAQLDGVVNSALLTCILFFVYYPPTSPYSLFISLI
jgi:hypothetical protein